MGALKMEYLNPIVVLAGAAIKSGNSMLASELLGASRGLRDCKAIKKQSKKYKGLTTGSIAYIVDTKVKQSAFQLSSVSVAYL